MTKKMSLRDKIVQLATSIAESDLPSQTKKRYLDELLLPKIIIKQEKDLENENK